MVRVAYVLPSLSVGSAYKGMAGTTDGMAAGQALGVVWHGGCLNAAVNMWQQGLSGSLCEHATIHCAFCRRALAGRPPPQCLSFCCNLLLLPHAPDGWAWLPRDQWMVMGGMGGREEHDMAFHWHDRQTSLL